MSSITATKTVVSAAFFVSMLVVDGAEAQARFFVYEVSSRTFTTFDVNGPGSQPCAMPGINDLGQIVGAYTTSSINLPCHGFVLEGRTATSFDYPGAYYTASTGINNAGQIVGTRCVFDSSRPNGTDCRAFLKDGGTFTSYEFPGALFTYGSRINNLGQIAGAYQIVTGDSQRDFGLLIDGATFTAFEFPGTLGSTAAAGINDLGVVVGTYTEAVSSSPGFRYRGFLKQGAQFSSIDFPGALFTFAQDVNNSGQIVGSYTDRFGLSHSFIKDDDTYISFGILGADTVASGLNNLGQIVGLYYPLPVLSTINALIQDLRLLGLPDGTRKSFAAKLKAAIISFNAGDGGTACKKMNAFGNQVEALAGKTFSVELSDWLLSQGDHIEAMLGCSL